MSAAESSYAVETQRTDLAAATAALAAAGYHKDASGLATKDGQPLELTVLTYPAQPDSNTLALAIQSQLKELGITVKISQVPEMITATRDPNTVWDMAIAGNGTTSLAGDPIARCRATSSARGPATCTASRTPTWTPSWRRSRWR